jgi:hypothetical protein
MSTFAKIENNEVSNIIVAEQDFIDTLDGSWISVEPKTIGKGWNYDSDNNVFYPPQPYASWTLDENYEWQPPVARPEGKCEWDEENTQWIVE